MTETKQLKIISFIIGLLLGPFIGWLVVWYALKDRKDEQPYLKWMFVGGCINFAIMQQLRHNHYIDF